MKNPITALIADDAPALEAGEQLVFTATFRQFQRYCNE